VHHYKEQKMKKNMKDKKPSGKKNGLRILARLIASHFLIEESEKIGEAGVSEKISPRTKLPIPENKLSTRK